MFKDEDQKDENLHNQSLEPELLIYKQDEHSTISPKFRNKEAAVLMLALYTENWVNTVKVYKLKRTVCVTYFLLRKNISTKG